MSQPLISIWFLKIPWECCSCYSINSLEIEMCYLARYSCRGEKKLPKQPQHLDWLIYQDCYSYFKLMLFKLKYVCLPAILFSYVFPKEVTISKFCINNECCPSSSAAPACFNVRNWATEIALLRLFIHNGVNNYSSLLCPFCNVSTIFGLS